MQLSLYILGAGLLFFLGAMLWVRKVVATVLAFTGVVGALSGIYIVFAAPFVGALQLIAYVGGILVLIAFSIMLTKDEEMRQYRLSFSSLLLATLTAISLLYGWQMVPVSSSVLRSEDATFRMIGILLLSKYGILIEIIALLLLVVLVGVVRLLVHSSDQEKSYE